VRLYMTATAISQARVGSLMCEIFQIELSCTAFASQSRFIFFDEEDDYKFLFFFKYFKITVGFCCCFCYRSLQTM